MNISIEEEVLNREDISFSSLLLLLFFKEGASIDNALAELHDKNLIKEIDGKLMVTSRGEEKCDNVLLGSDKAVPKKHPLEDLAISMMNLMPKIKMPGTPYFYRCNKREVTLKLGKFFKLYNANKEYTDADIIEATKKYVESFNGDYRYMKLLKYFILKNEHKVDSEGRTYIEETSQLATILENKDNVDPNNQNWLTELR